MTVETKLKINIFAITLFIIIVAVILTWFISQSISHPIQKLIRAVAEIGRGNLDTQVQIESNNEMGQLGASFNKMVADLKNTTTSIENLNREINERKKLESQLVQAQKLESIGQLAAGVAHEINTPIQYIGDNINFLQESFQDILRLLREYEQVRKQATEGRVNSELLSNTEDTLKAVNIDYLTEEAPRAIQESLEGVGNVARIVQAMKEFAHSGTKEKIAADLNHAIESTFTVTRNRWKYVADLETDFDPELPPVTCLVDEFNQVILNLIVNAADAITEKMGEESEDKGMISISTRRDGEWAEIRVTDTGGGIPEKIRERIFDPFFTTKEVGMGSGQGLTIGHSVIVDKHGGTLTFETELGRGTTFIIRLPIEPNQPTESDTHDTAFSIYKG